MHKSKNIKQLKMHKCWQEEVVRYEAYGAKSCKVEHIGHAFVHSSSVSIYFILVRVTVVLNDTITYK